MEHGEQMGNVGEGQRGPKWEKCVSDKQTVYVEEAKETGGWVVAKKCVCV